ncbi:MAG: GrpB family protein [Candidatus Zixiibacteriota bacterium]|nr:MAG: GrpB family protein [candidate division Zixibacteria bacterium]
MKSNKRIIRVVDYDSRWPDLFQIESKAISDALGDLIVHIHHIGGTSIPGSAAKPTIDIQLEVRDVNELDGNNAAMEQLGYTPEGEYGIPGRRYFHKGNPDRIYHVHAFNAGSSIAKKYIAFRDYLVAHPQIAKEYGELKRRCARDCDNDIEKYGDLKNDFIKTHEKLAIEWMRGR